MIPLLDMWVYNRKRGPLQGNSHYKPERKDKKQNRYYEDYKCQLQTDITSAPAFTTDNPIRFSIIRLENSLKSINI